MKRCHIKRKGARFYGKKDLSHKMYEIEAFLLLIPNYFTLVTIQKAII